MYIPSSEILEKYANVLINFALGDGKGVQPGEVVWVRIPECAKPMYVPLRNAILRAGGNPILHYSADDVENRTVFEIASDEQLAFFPEKYYKGLVDQIDHMVAIIAEHDKYELQGVDSQKIMLRNTAMRPYMQWREVKEAAGKFTWTLGMYGTPAMAADVGMSEEEYWEQIIAACFLDEADPVAKWREVSVELERLRGELNSLAIDYLDVQGEGINLKVGIGEGRKWLGGSGRNIPSFELFISPDCRRTEGEISFNQPLYYYGSKIDGIKLVFREGKIIEATARENESLLKEMISMENANQIGEYSLTDSRLSRITKMMGETLFDENVGGRFGNTHLAVGNAYKDSYPGDASKLTSKDWLDLGYNESAVHTDIISTADRTVTAYLLDGTSRIIYADGKFTF